MNHLTGPELEGRDDENYWFDNAIGYVGGAFVSAGEKMSRGYDNVRDLAEAFVFHMAGLGLIIYAGIQDIMDNKLEDGRLAQLRKETRGEREASRRMCMER